VAVEQRGQPFVTVPAGKQAPRIAQREHEQMNRFRLLSDPDLQLSVVDLRLFALAQSRTSPSRLPANAGDHDAALNSRCIWLVTAAEPQRHQFPMQHHSVSVHFWPALLDESDVTDRLRAAARRLPRLPAADSQPRGQRLEVGEVSAGGRVVRSGGRRTFRVKH
jgi:hypothetical protein